MKNMAVFDITHYLSLTDRSIKQTVYNNMYKTTGNVPLSNPPNI